MTHGGRFRLTFVDSKEYVNTVPSQMEWTRGSWLPVGSQPPGQRASALRGRKIALMDSGDCWVHQGAINPWHCGATMWNWYLLANKYSDEPVRPQDTAFLAVQGLDEMDERPGVFGHLEAQAVASEYVADYHDDDHKTRPYIMSKKHRVIF